MSEDLAEWLTQIWDEEERRLRRLEDWPDSIWVTPDGEQVVASVAVEVAGGPKRYARLFQPIGAQIDWGWQVHETAVEVWSEGTRRSVLARIAADRKILAEHRAEEVASLDRETRGQVFLVCRRCRIGERQPVWPCTTARLLALPHADRPGYREEWRP